MTSPSATVPAFSAAAVSAAASISVVSAYAGFSSAVICAAFSDTQREMETSEYQQDAENQFPDLG